MSEDISKKITIDVEINTDGQQQINQYKVAFDSLRNSISGLSNPLQGISGSISSLDKDISKLTGSIDKLNSQNQGLTTSGNKVKDSVNDIGTTFTSFKSIVETVKGSVASLEGALTGGLSIIVAYGPEILNWATSLVKGKEAVDKAKLSTDTLNKALESSDYSNAIQQMNELKINVGLAKKGFLDKKEVLQQYNDSVGKTMGKATDLNKVESILIKNGDAYIKMTLLKASAQLALQDAAKKAYEAEQDSLKSDDDTLSFMDKALAYVKEGALSAGGPGAASATGQAQVDLAVKATQKRKEAIDDANKQKDALLSVATKFETEAAAIAKNSGFDFYSGQMTAKAGSGNSDKNNEHTQVLDEAEKTLKDSLTRQLQTTYEAYGSETTAANNHYQEELNKLKKFLDDKKITRDEYNKVAGQLENEHHANISAIIDQFNSQDKERTEQAKNELAELQIKGMREGSAKQIAELNQEQKVKLQQIDKNDEDIKDRQKRLAVELAKILVSDPLADVSGLKSQLESVNQLLEINGRKKIAITQQTATAIKKITDQEKQDKLLKDDKDIVDTAKGPEAKLATEKKLIADKYQFEIDQAQGNSEKIKEIEDARNKAIKDLDDRATSEKTKKSKKAIEEVEKFEVDAAKKIADGVLSIVSQSIKQASESKVAALEQDKASELSNTSLTSAQKLAIEQKYKRQEAQIKAKAFKDEQEASIAQAVINGALAITKGASQTGVLAALYIPAIIAETAVQVAKIAAQKPPAYAAGGMHYTSDGRGGVLAGYSRTDNTNAYLRSGEGIVVSEAMRVPWARNLVSAINVGFGGRDFSISNPGRGYAVGGIFTDGGDANRYYNQPVHDQKNLANTIAYQMINNFPPVYVDVKDVNNQQNILAQTINRVNL